LKINLCAYCVKNTNSDLLKMTKDVLKHEIIRKEINSTDVQKTLKYSNHYAQFSLNYDLVNKV